jgi:hypothetical protein
MSVAIVRVMGLCCAVRVADKADLLGVDVEATFDGWVARLYDKQAKFLCTKAGLEGF